MAVSFLHGLSSETSVTWEDKQRIDIEGISSDEDDFDEYVDMGNSDFDDLYEEMEDDYADIVHPTSSCVNVFECEGELGKFGAEEFVEEARTPPLRTVSNSLGHINPCYVNEKDEYTCVPALETTMPYIKVEPLDNEELEYSGYKSIEETCNKTFEKVQTCKTNVSEQSSNQNNSYNNLHFSNINDWSNCIVKSEKVGSEVPEVHIETEYSVFQFPHITTDEKHQEYFYKIGDCENSTGSTVSECMIANCKYKGLPNPFVYIEPLDTKLFTDKKVLTKQVQSRYGRIIQNSLRKQGYPSTVSTVLDKKVRAKQPRQRRLDINKRSCHFPISPYAKIIPYATDTNSTGSKIKRQLETDQKALMSIPLENGEEQCVSMHKSNKKHNKKAVHRHSKNSKVPVPGIFEESVNIKVECSSSDKLAKTDQSSSAPLEVSKPKAQVRNLKPSYPLCIQKPHSPESYQGDSDVDVETDWDTATFKINVIGSLIQEEHNYCLPADNQSLKQGKTLGIRQVYTKKDNKRLWQSKSQGSTDADMDSLESRDRKLLKHNIKEKKRRGKLKELFIELHAATSGEDKTEKLTLAKIRIIKNATQIINRLKQESEELKNAQMRLINRSISLNLCLSRKEGLRLDGAQHDISD